MRFKWLGTATLLLEGGGTRLLIDPYGRPFAPQPPLPLEEARSAEAIFITHPHLDHFQDADVFSEGERPVYVAQGGIELAHKNGMQTGCMYAAAPGDMIRVGGLSVGVFAARHCRFDAATISRVLFSPRTWRHAKDAFALLGGARKFRIGRDDVLAFLVSDGEKSVFVFGSAGMAEGEHYPQGADLLIFPYQGRAHMERELLPFLRALRPRAVAIDHFDDAFPPVSQRVDTGGFLPAVQGELPSCRAYIPQENIWYEV